MIHREDSAIAGDSEYNPGIPSILPSSFTGGKRWLQQQYQDSMALTAKFSKPDFFITYTCNPSHPDIVDNLGNEYLQGAPKLQPNDRPDIVTATFKLHTDEFYKDMRFVFGEQEAITSVIEFQKRGLPHTHLALWLKGEHKLKRVDQIDRFIRAELPNPELEPELYRIVSTTMMHQCSPGRCLQQGVCSKGFPKDFADSTSFDSDTGRVIYKRRDDGARVESNGNYLDNRYVVPYNPYLLLKYRSHINTEACMSVSSIKYLFKYLHKGYDSAYVEKTVSSRDELDEIREYVDCRYIAAMEAVWRIREFPLCSKSHTIVRLAVHLQNNHMIHFRTGELPDDVLERDSGTTLTAWMDLNAKDHSARRYLYSEIPFFYTYTGNKGWVLRKRSVGNSEILKIVPRIYYVSPRDTERFYLRLILLRARGATTFSELKKYDGVAYETFEATCRAMGILESDQTWIDCMTEAKLTSTPSQLRFLFATVLANCNTSSPLDIWRNFKNDMSEDFIHFHDFTEEEARQHALMSIHSSLMSVYRTPITNFGFDLPSPITRLPTSDYDTDDYTLLAEDNLEKLNEEQKFIADTIIHELSHGATPSFDRPRIYFIHACGGCGKTFLANTLSMYCIANSLKFANAAWTGIVGTLLMAGTTLCSLFKLPVPINSTSTCSVRPNSRQADHLRSLSLIFIDEASMVPLDALRAIDILLRDITNNSVPFGGKLILMAGDFRQTLPIVPRASTPTIIENCIFRSPLWQYVTHLDLTKNVRADPSEISFKTWLLELGNGTLTSAEGTRGEVDIPTDCNFTDDIATSVFPDFNTDRSRSVIVTPLNEDADKLNDSILDRYEPQTLPREYLSVDRVVEDNNTQVRQVTTEFLNSLRISGLPPHLLKLKQGCTVMLLRNLDPRNGLCNGTRLQVVMMCRNVLKVRIVSGNSDFIGKEAFIPRIKICPSDFPFKFERLQFPIILSYCITINKSQGQEFDTVGIYLPSPVFSHGQLYVAFSRAKRYSSIFIQVKSGISQLFDKGNNLVRTVNVVHDFKVR